MVHDINGGIVGGVEGGGVVLRQKRMKRAGGGE